GYCRRCGHDATWGRKSARVWARRRAATHLGHRNNGRLAIEAEFPLELTAAGVQSIEIAIPRSRVDHAIDNRRRRTYHVACRKAPGGPELSNIVRSYGRVGIVKRMLKVSPVRRPIAASPLGGVRG